jgi:hypothetical protein
LLFVQNEVTFPVDDDQPSDISNADIAAIAIATFLFGMGVAFLGIFFYSAKKGASQHNEGLSELKSPLHA